MPSLSKVYNTTLVAMRHEDPVALSRDATEVGLAKGGDTDRFEPLVDHLLDHPDAANVHVLQALLKHAPEVTKEPTHEWIPGLTRTHQKWLTPSLSLWASTMDPGGWETPNVHWYLRQHDGSGFTRPVTRPRSGPLPREVLHDLFGPSDYK
jgi:hypothetical protein